MLLMLMLILSGCGQKAPVEDIYENQPVSDEVPEAEEASVVDETAEVEEVEEPFALRVIVPYGTPALSMVKMMTEEPVIGENVTVTYEALAAADVLTAELINHEADIAIVPTNLAAVLHAKEAGYKIAGSSVWGVLYLVAMEEMDSLEDLKGKTISLIGRGLTPDAMMQYILMENGIDPETDLTLEYFGGSSELAANFISGQSEIALIPQPLLTAVLSKKEGAKVVVDLQEEWGELTGEPRYPLSSIIVSEALIEHHPEVAEDFLSEFEAGVVWLNEHPEVAGTYYEALDIGLAAPVVTKAIPQSNLTYMSVTESREAFDRYLTVLHDFNPKLTGGKPVDEALYFEK